MMNHNPNNNLDSLTGMMVDDGSGGGAQLAQSVPSGTVDSASANTSNIQLLIGLNGAVSGYHHPHQQHQAYHNQPISIVSSSSGSTTNNNDPNNTMDPNQGYTLYQVQYSGGNQLDSYEPVHWNNKNLGQQQQQMTYENQTDNSGLAQHHLILQPSGHQLGPQQQQILVQQQSPDSQQLIWTTHHPNQNYHVTAVNSSNGLSLQTQQSSEMYLTNNGSSLVSLDPTSFGSQIIQQQYNPQPVTTTSSSGSDPSLSSPSAITSSATTSTVPVPSAKPAAPKRTTKRGQKNNAQGGEPGVRTAKPVSAYALFFRDTQASVKAESPSATFGDVSKIVASKWEVLAKAEKDVYKERADQEKLNYLQNLASSKAKQVAGMQQTVDGGATTAITSTSTISTNDPGSISQDNLTISSSTGSSVGFIQPSPSIQVHSQGDSSGQVSTTTTATNNNNNNNQYQAQQVVVVDPSSSMLGLLGNSSVPASSNGLVTGQQQQQLHHHQMLSYQDPSSYHHQLLHQHHHQSTLNPVMSQSSFDQYSMNSGQVSNGSQQQQQQSLIQHHLGHHQDALSLIGDNSFFNSVDSSSTSNLIDSLGLDLTDLDDKLDSLLSSGGILSPGTSSVFDTALDAQDYLMNELNGMTDTTVHHHQDQNGPSHEQHDLYSSLGSIQPDSSQLVTAQEEEVSVELLPAVPESSQQSTEDDSQEQQQQEDHTVGDSYKDVEQQQYQQTPNSLPQDESPVEAVEPAPSCPPPARCIRSGCDQLSVSSPQWDNEFCSEQCCVKYCSQIFQQWTSRPDKTTSSQADTLPSTNTTASELTSLGPAGTSLPLPTSYIAS